jgi:hypothetical protein
MMRRFFLSRLNYLVATHLNAYNIWNLRGEP